MKAIGIVFILLPFFCKAQEDSTLVKGTHIFIAKVIQVDTVILTNKEYLLNSKIPVKNFSALRVRLKILSKIKGKFRGRKANVLIDIYPGDHECSYEFLENKTYKIHAFLTRFVSEDIAKEYRKHFFRIDCLYLPELVGRGGDNVSE